MTTKTKTGGGTGTNQYKVQGTAKAKPRKPPMVSMPPVEDQLALWEATEEETPPPIERPWSQGFSVREPLWRGVGSVLPEYPESRDEAKLYAGHRWEPVDTPVYEESGVPGSFVPIPGYKRIVRSDTGAVLGVGSTTRATIGIDDMYDIVEGLAKDPGISYESGGILEGGKSAWIIAKLDAPITVPGDDSRIYPYLAVHNRIAGPGACNVQWTTMRTASASSLSIRELTGADSEVITPLSTSIRHTKNWKARVNALEQSVMGVREQSEAFQKRAIQLAEQRVTPAQVSAFVARFIPMPPEGVISDIVRDNVNRDRSQFMNTLQSRTNRGINQTGWGLVMAACEYTDHIRSAKSMESRFKRSLLKPEPQKRKAVRIVESLV